MIMTWWHFMESASPHEIVAMKIVDVIEFLKSKQGYLYFEGLVEAVLREFNSESVGGIVKEFLENPRESYKRLVKALGGLECTAKALLICILGELVKRYAPKADVVKIIKAIESGNNKFIRDCTNSFVKKLAAEAKQQSPV
ncbi:MAG: hypothetical protein KIH01_06150 [Candidatus Freyarchaeota archaeon]|nr:hypothetical protein [Candidatus Jordarchaeia archaeon]